MAIHVALAICIAMSIAIHIALAMCNAKRQQISDTIYTCRHQENHTEVHDEETNASWLLGMCIEEPGYIKVHDELTSADCERSTCIYVYINIYEYMALKIPRSKGYTSLWI